MAGWQPTYSFIEMLKIIEEANFAELDIIRTLINDEKIEYSLYHLKILQSAYYIKLNFLARKIS